MKVKRVQCAALAFALFAGTLSAQTNANPRHRTGKPPTVQQNQQLMNSLDHTIDENDKILREHGQDLLVGVELKLGESSMTTQRLKHAFDALEAAYGGYRSHDAYDSRKYADALYEVIVTVAGLFTGPIGWSADATDLLRTVGENWVVARYQAKLVEQRWNLAQAIQIAQFKDPNNQAEFKRVLDRLNADLPSERADFKNALANSGQTEQSLFKDLPVSAHSQRVQSSAA